MEKWVVVLVENHMLNRIEKDEKVVGTFLELNDSLVVEALSVAGLDFFIVDGEHSVTTIDKLKEFVQAANFRNITPLVRVPETTRSNILRPLDVGIQGLVIPNVRSVEEVERIISWSKYPPLGQRGFFTSRVMDFGYDKGMEDLGELFEETNNNIMIIPQCETVEALENIEEIVALDGVSGIFIGPFDLSIALGIPTQFDHPKFTEAIERIYKVCREHNKFTMIFSMDADTAKNYLNEGFDAITLSMDVSLLIDSAKAALEKLKD